MPGYGDRIRALRDELGWSQDKLGKEAQGLSRDTINRAEQSDNLRINTIYQIAAGLGVPIGAFFGAARSTLSKQDAEFLRMLHEVEPDQRAYCVKLLTTWAHENGVAEDDQGDE